MRLVFTLQPCERQVQAEGVAVLEPALIELPARIETPRLYLRAPEAGDGPSVHRAILETFPELQRWMVWCQGVPTVERVEADARDALASFIRREELRLHIYRRADDVFVGCTGLHAIDWRVPRFEIGYWCRASLQRQGLLSEAVRGLLRFALDELGARRVEIRCDPRNVASQRIPESIGVPLESRMIDQTVDVEGEPRDTLLYVAGPPHRGLLRLEDPPR